MSKTAYNLACECCLRATTKAVLKELAWYANDEGKNTWPSVRTLASRTGLTRRTVQKILRELEGQGAITAVGNRLGGRRRTTHYNLEMSWLESHIESQKGERGDTERANGTAQKGEPDSPEQKEQEYEQNEKPVSDKRKSIQAPPYEQQRLVQAAKSAMRTKSFPRTTLTKEELQARRMYLKQQTAEVEGRFRA